MLRTEVNKMVEDLYNRKKYKMVDLVNYKLKSDKYTYEEKNNYIEYNIEDCLKYFGTEHMTSEM